MRKRVLAVIGLVTFVALHFAFWQKALENPETRKSLLSLIRDSPVDIFYPITIGFLLLVTSLFLWILLTQKEWLQIATQRSIQDAKTVASSLWWVEGLVLNKKDRVVVQFRHLSFSRLTFTLPVQLGHPDIDKFRQLKDGDTVEFEALYERMGCAMEYELCGFIRIKSVS